MDMKCSYNHCEIIPDYYCSCEGYPVFICEDHYINHLKGNKFKAHTILPVFKSVSRDFQSKLINNLKEIIKTNNSLKQSLIETTERLLSISSQIINNINELNKFIYSNIKQVSKHFRIFIPASHYEKKLAEELNSNDISFTEIEKLISDFSRRFKLQDLQDKMKTYLEKNSTLIIKIIQICFEPKGIFINPNIEELDANEINFDEKELFFFKHNTKLLYKFTPSNENISVSNIENIELQGLLASICKVDKDNLFVYGGYTNVQLPNTFLINTLSNSVTELPLGEKCTAASCQLFKKKVYVFGCQSTTVTSFSRYFDLVQKIWVSIAALPSPQRDTSTLLLNSEILITGSQNFLYAYSLSENQYKNINWGISIGHFNILIFYSSKIFLLVNNFVYLCEDLINKTKWNQFNLSLSFEYTSSKPCFHGKYAYFVNHVHKIYRFDCESRLLTMIQLIN